MKTRYSLMCLHSQNTHRAKALVAWPILDSLKSNLWMPARLTVDSDQMQVPTNGITRYVSCAGGKTCEEEDARVVKVEAKAGKNTVVTGTVPHLQAESVATTTTMIVTNRRVVVQKTHTTPTVRARKRTTASRKN